MIVRCNQCGTEFGLDERQIGDEGMAVRCSVCKNVFRVETSPPKPVPWHVQTTDGTKFSAANLATLREWIEEGRLHPDDKVSRTGRSWVRLGDMPEFASVFEDFVDVPAVVKPVLPVRVEVGSSVRPIARGPELKVPPISRRPEVMPPTPVRGTTSPEIELEDDERTMVRQRPVEVGPAVLAPAVSAAAVSAPAVSPPLVVDDEDLTRQMYRPAVAMPASMGAPAIEYPVRSEPVRVEPTTRSRPAPQPAPVMGGDSEPDDFEVVPKRRPISPGLIAFLGVIAAFGIMFGVPSIRERLLALGGSGSGSDPAPAGSGSAPTPTDVPAIAQANAATNQLGLAELAKAEAALQRELDAGTADAATSAAVKVALAELRLSRSLAHSIAAALDSGQREVYQTRARGDQDDGERLVDSLEGTPDVERLGEVRALGRLAAGRDTVEIMPLIPEGELELELIVRAAVLWRDGSAPVPDGLVADLQGLAAPSGLAEGALALALVRANDEPGARNVLERLLVRANDQIVGVALRTRLGEPTETETGAEAGETGAETGETGEDAGTIAKAPPIPVPVPGGGGGGSSFDKLLDRGCEAARNGSAEAGVDLLLKAFDDQPNDLDVLVCLGDGYARQGQNRRAADFYDRALDRSPKFKPALAGAAEIAVKTGATVRAIKLYETLLSVDPDHPDAKAFLAKQQASDSGGEQEPPPAGPSEGG